MRHRSIAHLAARFLLAGFALVGCTFDLASPPSSQPSQSAPSAPSPSPTVLASRLPRVILFNVSFTNDGASPSAVLLNETDRAVDLNGYTLAYSWSASELATSSLVDAQGHPIATLPLDSSLRVYLEDSTSPYFGDATAPGLAGCRLSYEAGGALALVKPDGAIEDFIQWGVSGTRLEPLAVEAGLWEAGEWVAADGDAALGLTLSVLTPAATGSANWID